MNSDHVTERVCVHVCTSGSSKRDFVLLELLTLVVSTNTTPRSTTKARNRIYVSPEQNTKRKRLSEMEAQNVLVDCTKQTYPEVENLGVLSIQPKILGIPGWGANGTADIFIPKFWVYLARF